MENKKGAFRLGTDPAYARGYLVTPRQRYNLNLNIMKKKQIFWLIVAIAVVTLIVLVKVFPFWVSLTSVISFGCGVVLGFWGKMFRDKYIK